MHSGFMCLRSSVPQLVLLVNHVRTTSCYFFNEFVLICFDEITHVRHGVYFCKGFREELIISSLDQEPVDAEDLERVLSCQHRQY